MKTQNEFHVPGKSLKGLLRNAERSAEIIDLIYTSDQVPGIKRVKQGHGFVYFKGAKKITRKKDLDRIKQLVIPPAWENVWICTLPNGHLQATGLDIKNRKQYRYHASWSAFRNQTKFYQLLEFGKRLPVIRKQLEKDLARRGLPLKKVLAAAVLIMEQTNIRVGNNVYEKLYGSFGLTTLKDKHVRINGNSVRFCFKGKKGVYHEIDLKSRRLARIVKQCRDIPGSELFQYYDGKGKRKAIDSGMINSYIKTICCDDFTTKDFRTWMGSVYALEALREMGPYKTETEKKGNVVSMFDQVAQRLGNTRAVCKKYYIHPAIPDLYENKMLEGFFSPGNQVAMDNGFSEAETILMNILNR